MPPTSPGRDGLLRWWWSDYTASHGLFVRPTDVRQIGFIDAVEGACGRSPVRCDKLPSVDEPPHGLAAHLNPVGNLLFREPHRGQSCHRNGWR
ncbi:MAG TPA: hypothetical protein VN541_00285 [Tepidisphaeraceae bacterium]|nr:hypothetical protein [Tepidisphaeraceae bacterium]